MWPIFKIFWNAEDTRPVLVLLCLVVGGLAEAIGIGSMLPVLGAMLGTGGGTPSFLETLPQQALEYLGLPSSLGYLIVFVLLLMLLRTLVLFASMTYAGVTGVRVTMRLRRRLIRALFGARWRHYAGLSSGVVANSLGNDATRSGEAYTLSAATVALLMQITGYVCVALLINWRVALLALAAGLVLALASRRLVAITKRTGYKQTDRISTFSADTADMLHNIKALKAMNRFDAPLANLTKLLKRLKRTLYTFYIAKYALHFGNDLLVALLVGVGAWLAHRYGTMPPAQLLVFGILFFQVISYVNKFMKQMQAAAAYEGAYMRISGLIAETEAAAESITGNATPVVGAGCRFEHVTFAHTETPVVQNVSFNIPANKITVLQGPSGAGKTTLLDLLVGFHRPDSGRIVIGSEDLANIDLKQWRSRIGYVPQELMLFHDDVKNNISLYDEQVSDQDIAEAARLAGATDFLSAFPAGLETDVGELGTRLSGGQRQRIALARALVRKPDVLILDEVTSALDPETEAGIVDNIQRLKGQFTIIVITHRPAWTRIADNLFQVEGGKVKEIAKSGKKPARKLKT